jgi:FkbM family methyltransferase
MFQKAKKLTLDIFGPKYYNIIQRFYGSHFFNLKDGLKGLFIDKTKFFNLYGLQFKFPKSNLWDYGRNFRGYELSEKSLIRKYIKKNDIVLELGGSVGVISCVLNKILSNNKNHVVVEPNPNLIPFLKINKERNSCGFNIDQCIVSNSFSEIDFYVYDNYLSSSVFNSNNLKGEKHTVKSFTISHLCNKYKLKFNSVVMDIEGHEYDFLSENNLNEFNKMIIEFHPNILGKEKMDLCEEILVNNSFKMTEKKGSVEVWIK